MPDVYAALADPTRRRILELVGARERSVNELVAAFRLPQPAVSKQLRVLNEVGLVTVRPEGPRRYYALRPDPLWQVEAWLAQSRAQWSARLDALERELQKPQSKRRKGRR